MSAAWERTTCRACQGRELVKVLDLGEQPPANGFLTADELGQVEPRYPLELQLCQACGMVQLGHVVPPELLFRSYLFSTGSSARMAGHFARLMAEYARRVPSDGWVVEIGSNDGTALASLPGSRPRRLGIDPALNVADVARARGVPTLSEFFSFRVAEDLVTLQGRAHLIVACNVLGHVDDLDDFLRGVRELLHPDGCFVVEVPYLPTMLREREYDTIYHEHLSYFALRPLAVLLQRHDLAIQDARFFAVHGGSLRLQIGHGQQDEGVLLPWLRLEEQTRVAEPGPYVALATWATENRLRLQARLRELRAAGRRVAGYGAPAKGTVRLNYCQIQTDLVTEVFDCTAAKQGRYVPGTHQLVRSPTELMQDAPDYLLLLAWNHAAEILEREQAFRYAGGKFLTPWLEEL